MLENVASHKTCMKATRALGTMLHRAGFRVGVGLDLQAVPPVCGVLLEPFT